MSKVEQSFNPASFLTRQSRNLEMLTSQMLLAIWKP